MDKSNKIVELTKKKSKEKKEYVLEVIDAMLRNGEKVTFYSVYKKAGVSKSFVYNNEEIRTKIELCRSGELKVEDVKDSKDLLIDELNKEVQKLREKLAEYKKDELWKYKYENPLNKIEIEVFLIGVVFDANQVDENIKVIKDICLISEAENE